MERETGRIIPAVTTDKGFREALQSTNAYLFHLNASLLKIATMARMARENGKKLFIHLDLASGLGHDAAALQFLARVGITGIISTRAGLISLAKAEGLQTVQRLFIMDSRSIGTGMESLRAVVPDMVEIMPGISTKVVERFATGVHLPIIAGGLIETPEEVEAVLQAGASYISTSHRTLWEEEKL